MTSRRVPDAILDLHDPDENMMLSRSNESPPFNTDSQQQNRKSTNPFRQNKQDRQDRQERHASGITIPRPLRSSSQDTETSASGIKKNAPPRAVFFDLPTAHSSITSGTARSHGRNTPTELLDSLEDEHSILLQELDPSTRPTDFRKNAPLPPMPAVLPSSRYGDSPEDYLANQRVEVSSGDRGRQSTRIQPEARSVPSSVFNVFKHALGASSSPAIAEDVSNVLTPAKWIKSEHSRIDPRRSDGRHLDIKTNDKSVDVVATHHQSHTPKPRHVLHHTSSNGYSGDLSSAYHSSSGERSSSVQKVVIGENQSRRLDNSSRRRGFGYYAEPTQFGKLPSTPDDPIQDLPLPPKLYKSDVQSNDGSSLPDGSTVGNIYKHYQGSRSSDEQSEYDLPRLDKGKEKRAYGQLSQKQSVSTAARANNQLRPSALVVRKQSMELRHGNISNPAQSEPPNYGLPDAPSKLLAPRMLLSSSQGLAPSSSYGDTNQLLDIEQRDHWAGFKPGLSRSNGRGDLRSENLSPEYGDSNPPTINFSSPFGGPQVVISRPTDNNSVTERPNYATADREPLEREVSNALRRASGFSAYSNGSVASSILQYTDYQSDLPSSDSIGQLRRQDMDGARRSDSGSDSGVAESQMQAFYNQGAIAPGWVNNQHTHGIRIPINHTGYFSSSPPESPPPTSAVPGSSQNRTAAQVSDDVNDWETVGDSAFGGYKSNGATDGMIGGTVNRAGSSIANTSDEGTSSSSHIPEYDEYGSTERFVQHPGPIEYHSDYRLRDLKNTRTPVFLPKFREHKVNGYLADSNRTRPPVNLFNYAPRPLEEHTNPFKSPPPERMPTQKPKPSHKPRHYRAPTPLPFSLKTFNTIDSGVTENSLANNTAPSRAVRRSQINPNWMDDFGDPGPAIQTPKQQLHNSYDHVMILANGGSIPGFNPNGTRIEYLNSNVIANANDGFVETEVYGGLANPRDRKPLVKGPPGAFYRGVQQRIKAKTSRYAQTHAKERAVMIRPFARPAKDFPTNRLRPLSMLRSSPITPEGNEPNRNLRGNDFIYRSPLGPPKRHSTHLLYKQSQLDKFQAISRSARHDSRLSSKDSGFQRQLFETPRLYANLADVEARPDLYLQKRKVSVLLLCLCNLFPPLLGLYAVGRLDGIMIWWTDGEILTFGRTEKRYAYILTTCWAVLILLAMVIFLVYWFSYGVHHR